MGEGFALLRVLATEAGAVTAAEIASFCTAKENAEL
jgi:hypothetical protein